MRKTVRLTLSPTATGGTTDPWIRLSIRKMPKELQRLLGYHSFGLGVDGRDPIDVLNVGIVINPTAKSASRWRE